MESTLSEYKGKFTISWMSFSPLSDKVSPLQLYFYDTEHGIDNRMKHSKKLRPSILKKLIQILSINLFSAFFGSLTNVENLDTRRIVINSNLGFEDCAYEMVPNQYIQKK